MSPKKAGRKPWELFFVGFVYATLSIGLVSWIFSQDVVLAKYSGILVVTFTVMFSMPFMYYSIKLEEEKDLKTKGFLKMLFEHKNALLALSFLFLGFVIAFSLWYVVISHGQSFRAQIETYCIINRPTNFNECVSEYGIKTATKTTSFATNKEKLFIIFVNNIYVLIFTLVFSLIFGAGAIFVLAWNASVIAAAVGIFTRAELASLPIGILRYMLHGVLEILGYFIGALAGGIISVAIIKHEMNTPKFWDVLQDSLNLIILAVIVLFVAAIVEVFLTPLLF